MESPREDLSPLVVQVDLGSPFDNRFPFGNPSPGLSEPKLVPFDRPKSDSGTEMENKSNQKMLQSDNLKLLDSNKANTKAVRSSGVSLQSRSNSGSGVETAKQKKDDFIMDTNKSSIVSKRSVEKLYYEGQPEYYRYFVSKFKRRSPLVNRGYWLRMKAIEHSVSLFLSERTAKRKVVVILGCG